MIRRLVQHPTVRQMIKYGIVGFTTLVIDFAVYLALTRGTVYFRVHYLQANAAAIALDFAWNFYWNQRWTFRIGGLGSGAQYVSFCLIAAIGFGWNQLILWLLVSRFDIHDIIAKLIAIAIVFFWNFFMQRAITFGAVAAFVERNRKTYTDTVT